MAIKSQVKKEQIKEKDFAVEVILGKWPKGSNRRNFMIAVARTDNNPKNFKFFTSQKELNKYLFG